MIATASVTDDKLVFLKRETDLRWFTYHESNVNNDVNNARITSTSRRAVALVGQMNG